MDIPTCLISILKNYITPPIKALVCIIFVGFRFGLGVPFTGKFDWDVDIKGKDQ